MTDLEPILALWRDLRITRTDYVLGTVVAVEGSGYRKPGARMLIASDGRRSGTISGGCLENEVVRKAFWHTEQGPVVRRYSTSADDGEVPFGMGCGGIIHLLLERSVTADSVMMRLATSFAERRPVSIVTVLDGASAGRRTYWPAEHEAGLQMLQDETDRDLDGLARQGFEEQRSFSHPILDQDGNVTTARVEWIAPRPGLFVFGAGDDAMPMVTLARQLGWYVGVADGRSHLATQARFCGANEVQVLVEDSPLPTEMRSTDAAVVMTHSLAQDTNILQALLAANLAYIGVLGPRRRTYEIVSSLARKSNHDGRNLEAQIRGWMKRLHAPVGLDLGGNTPSDIALAVIAEIQQSRHAASGLPLREVRAGNADKFADSPSFP